MSKRLSINMLLQAITGLMAIALIASLAIFGWNALDRSQSAARVAASTDIGRDLFRFMQALRAERKAIDAALDLAKPADAATRDAVATVRARGDQALEAALAKLAGAALEGTGAAPGELRQDRDRFAELRQQADAALLKPRDQRPAALTAKWRAGGAKLVSTIDALTERLASDAVATDPFVAEMMNVKQLAALVRGGAGADRQLIEAALANPKTFPAETRRQLTLLSGRIDAGWAVIEDEARRPVIPAALNGAIATAGQLYFGELRAKRKVVIDQLTIGKPAGFSAAEWDNFSDRSLEALIGVANTAFDLAVSHAVEQQAATQRDFHLALLLILGVLGLASLRKLLVIRRVTRPMAQITAAMRAVAAGDLAQATGFEQRGDAVGELARALAAFRDTARAKARLEDELIRKERLSGVGELTARVAHELRNPLAAIRNAAFLLHELMTGRGSTLDRSVERIERSVARCDRILTDLLAFTRLRDLKRAPIAADPWLDAVLDGQTLPEGVALIRKLAAPGERIDIDAERMRQAVANLVENAAQATSKAAGGRVTVSTRMVGAAFELAVEDNGPGIPADILPKVFEPLFSTKQAGTGLGLPMVKQIVEQHGGTVVVVSEVGKGTLVTIRLPQRAATEIAA